MLLLVVTPDPVCVRSAEVAIDRALEVKPSLETAMIINRFNKLEVMAGRQMKLDDVIDGTHQAAGSYSRIRQHKAYSVRRGTDEIRRVGI